MLKRRCKALLDNPLRYVEPACISRWKTSGDRVVLVRRCGVGPLYRDGRVHGLPRHRLLVAEPLCDLLDLRLAIDRLTLGTEALVPLAGHLTGELAVAEPEREGQRESNGTEDDGERRRDDFRRDAQLLERHEHRQQDHAALPRARERGAAMERARAGEDEAADEVAEHDPEDHD